MLFRSTGTGEIINTALRKALYGGTGAPLTGTGLVTADIVKMFLARVLDIDQRLAPFTIISLEEPYRTNMKIRYDGNDRDIILGGTIDRIDERNGIRRLIDYKTGSADPEIKSLDELFNSDRKSMNDAAVQTLIYCVIMSGKEEYSRLRPVIYALRSSSSDEFEDRLVIEENPILDFSLVANRVTDILKHIVSRMFNLSAPFEMTTEHERCRFCPYKELCNR